jgi:hypothetical protein
MNEQELRGLVREAVERHLGVKRERESFSPSHPSHILLKIVPGSEAEDGACVIEPSVRCNHCGFCQSYGH